MRLFDFKDDAIKIQKELPRVNIVYAAKVLRRFKGDYNKAFEFLKNNQVETYFL